MVTRALLAAALLFGCAPRAPGESAAPDAARPADAAPTPPGLAFPQGAPLSRARLAALPGAGEFSAQPPNAVGPIRWRGVPLSAALDAALGDGWRAADELLLTCVDGYQPTYPVARVLAHGPWVVWARADAAPFAHTFPSHSAPVALGPYFLVWPPAEGDLGWAYQITTFETVTFAERFAALLPPPEAPAAAQRGFEVWRKQCTKCHRLSGVGGTIGPELNAPVSVTTYWSEGWLRRWIRSPQSIRAGSTMPPVALTDAALDDLLAYLRAKAPPTVPPTRP